MDIQQENFAFVEKLNKLNTVKESLDIERLSNEVMNMRLKEVELEYSREIEQMKSDYELGITKLIHLEESWNIESIENKVLYKLL